MDHYHLELPFPWVEYVDLGGDVSREIRGSAGNRQRPGIGGTLPGRIGPLFSIYSTR